VFCHSKHNSRVIDFFAGVNGTYPLRVVVNDYRLQGEASVQSPHSDAGRIRFQLTPQPGLIEVFDVGSSNAPSQIKTACATL
jgi:hypothetical protein